MLLGGAEFANLPGWGPVKLVHGFRELCVKVGMAMMGRGSSVLQSVGVHRVSFLYMELLDQFLMRIGCCGQDLRNCRFFWGDVFGKF